MSRKSIKRITPEADGFGTLPSYLSEGADYAIRNGLDPLNALPIPDEDKPRLEWLAKGFGLTPKWKQGEGGKGEKKL